MIKIQDLWKQYQLGNTVDVGKNFREAVTSWFQFGLGSKTEEPVSQGKFWALREINLDIPSGKTLGLIGHNGAGKSTLLKVLSRITRPTRGQVTIYGRVASLLEVGTGFHPELSGRENIYLYGAIMGMSKRDIGARFDQIVDYAGVEQFLDTPVKRYSSGMYVRLAFSIAAHVEPDVLIVDEVLAVGDQAFRSKCLGKMEDVAESGRTVVFVSHNLNSILSLCDHTAWLDHGQVLDYGDTSDVVSAYKNHYLQSFDDILIQDLMKGPLAERITFSEISINEQVNNAHYNVRRDQKIHVSLTGYAQVLIANVTIKISFYHEGTRLFTLCDIDGGETLKQGHFRAEFSVPANILHPNNYQVGIGAKSEQLHGEWMWADNLFEVTIADLSEKYSGADEEASIINVSAESGRLSL